MKKTKTWDDKILYKELVDRLISYLITEKFPTHDTKYCVDIILALLRKL